MNEQDAKLLQMTANTDQAVAAVKHIAIIIRGYFAALREAGFTLEEAMLLTLDYQQTLLKSVRERGHGNHPA